MTAEITLRIPHERPYHGVARLVVGGLAARLDLSYEDLEDLQLALAGVLASSGPGREVTIELVVRERRLELRIGPFDPAGLEDGLARETDEGIGLARLLGAVVEQVEVLEREDGGWVRLEKRLDARPSEDGGAGA